MINPQREKCPVIVSCFYPLMISKFSSKKFKDYPCILVVEFDLNFTDPFLSDCISHYLRMGVSLCSFFPIFPPETRVRSIYIAPLAYPPFFRPMETQNIPQTWSEIQQGGSFKKNCLQFIYLAEIAPKVNALQDYNYHVGHLFGLEIE